MGEKVLKIVLDLVVVAIDPGADMLADLVVKLVKKSNTSLDDVGARALCVKIIEKLDEPEEV